MQPSTIAIAAIASLISIAPASADLITKFDEGAPKDRFTFSNASNCALNNAIIRLDLSGSKAGLIFDTTDKGAGVEVFQPLEFVTGTSSLTSLPKVRDGDRIIELKVAELAPQQTIAFTIDVDDTMGGREITVSDSEIQGATVQLLHNAATITTAFNTRSKAVLRLPKC
ncbi:MAG: aggregation factor core [Pseudomonadota bacterium]